MYNNIILGNVLLFVFCIIVFFVHILKGEATEIL